MAIHKYFIKVVPTTYIPGGLLSKDVETYQFSVTKFIQEVDTLKRIFLPGNVFECSNRRNIYNFWISGSIDKQFGK
jgi:hypothetical protein